tara:strand:- start:120 stop:686 length:567 start_codon:yes stop_codon:yes gene_type:complete
MSNILNIQKSLKIKGNDALSFVDSLISNNLDDEILKPSYLLRPDGKINHWFFAHTMNDEVSIYQESNELQKILDSLMKYAIRVECEFLIETVSHSLIGKIGNSEIKIVDEIFDDAVSWEVYEIINEIPSKKIINNGLLPNETKWLNDFVDFEKGCFLGQEQASRIKYRGKPRRVLITNENGQQEMLKI